MLTISNVPIEWLQGRGVPQQFGLSQWSGNVSLVPSWTSWLPCSYVHRQLILGLRTRHSKCTGAKVRDRGGDYKVGMSGGSESLSAADRCDWSIEVSDVWRCQSMQCVVCQQTQLELNVLRDMKPVKAVSQYVLDVVVLLGARINRAAVFSTDCSRSIW